MSSARLDRRVDDDTQVAGVRPSRRVLWIHLALLAVGLVCWLAAVARISPASISGWGLLPGLTVTWWLALALAVVPQLFAALRADTPAGISRAYQALLILVLLGTTSAVYAVPRYPWTYKHIGVVEYLLRHGSVDRALDIYHDWPGFFAFAAGLSTLTGISPLSMARWAEPVFCFATICAISFALRSIIKDRRVLALSSLLFILGMWTGAMYFSPQAFAMVLAMLVLGAFLRVFPARTDTNELIPRRLTARLLRGAPLVPSTPVDDRASSLPARAGAVAATVLWCCLVVSHQLTPYALLVVMGLMVVVVRVRHLWLLGVWAALTLGWTALALPLLIRNGLVLVDSNAVSGLAPPTAYIPQPELPGMGTTGSASAILLVAFPLAAAAVVVWGFFRRREALLVPAVLGFGSGLLLLVQSYGGEAVYRVYLYGLPWWSLVIATVVVRSWDPGRLRKAVVCGCTVLVSGLSVMAGLGQEIDYHVDPADVAASTWLETHAARGSFVVSVSGLGFPLRLTASYPDIQYAPVSLDVYLPHPLADGDDEVLGQFPAFTAKLKGQGYLVITNTQRTYGRAYGTVTGAEWDRLGADVSRRPDFEVVYDQGGDLIARYLGPPTAAR